MPPTTTVLFVCLHGSAKSQIAAHHLERLASARGFPLRSASAGMEPDASIPSHVVAGLRADGIDVATASPIEATADLVSGADYVVSFGCDVSCLSSRQDVTVWADAPAVSDGYESARDFIVTRLQGLLDEIATAPSRSANR